MHAELSLGNPDCFLIPSSRVTRFLFVYAMRQYLYMPTS
jgi:hypothetical protein